MMSTPSKQGYYVLGLDNLVQKNNPIVKQILPSKPCFQPYNFLNTNKFILYAPPKLAPVVKNETKEPIFLSGITVDITGDINLLNIDKMVKEKFKWQEETEVSQLKQKITSIENGINKIQDIAKIADLKRKKDKINARIDKIISKESESEYLNDSKELLDEYVKSLKVSVDAKKKKEIMKNYINVAKKYIPIDLIKPEEEIVRCDCGYDLKEATDSPYCPQCAREHHLIVKFNRESSEEYIKTDTDNYTPTENLKKALDKYQGKTCNPPLNKIIPDLEQYFISKGIESGEKIRSQKLNERGFRGDTTPQMLFEALKETGNSAFYDDYMYIGHIYWGWELRDLSKEESTILENDRKIQSVFNSIQKRRHTALNVWFRCFKHAQIVGHKCLAGDFKLPKEPATRGEHEILWAESVRGAGLPYYQTSY